MDIVTGIIKLLFGSKADKDRKAIEPYVNKIKEVYPSIAALSNDELRGRSQALMKQIADFIAPDEERIVTLKAQLERAETALEEKEKISKEIDEITKRIDEKIEQKLDEILPEAFAIMKDTARRFAENETVTVTANDFDRQLAASKDFVTIDGDKAVYATHWLAGGNDVKWDMVHYDVQLFGGVVLHKGKIAEMATGEGKTLVATLPVFLNALARKGVHMVTVNNYLAKRDSEWMGPMYEFHGLSVACIDDTQPNSAARRQAYMADITFGTNNEYGFDYLRDNMASSPKDLVQRKHHFAIVDEVDSVLIDDARTPLIISGPVPKGDDQLYEQYRPAIENLYNLQKNLVTGLVAEAKQLMADAGYADGFDIECSVSPGLLNSTDVVQAIASQLAQIGINVTIKQEDSATQRDEIGAGTVAPLFLQGLGGPYCDINLIASIGFTEGARYCTWVSPEFMDLASQAASEMDAEKRVALYSQMQQMMVDEAPALWLYQQDTLYAYNSKKVQNWTARTDEVVLMDGVSVAG